MASIIHKLNRTTSELDLFLTKLLISHLSSIISIILRIVNLCFSSGDFPASCKSEVIFFFEKAIVTQIHSHLININIVDNFQSAYKTGHSCETALLRVYNDTVTTFGRGNGAMLVLGVMVQCLCYMIYLLLLTPWIIIICFANLKIFRNLW